MNPYNDQPVLKCVTAWWTRWGKGMLWLLTVALIAFSGGSGWKYWQKRQTARASVLYEQLQQALSSEPTPSSAETKKARILRIAADLETQFGRTPYAQMGALTAARALYQASDRQGAKAQLQWVADSAVDAEYRSIARLRLAALLLEEKAYDVALHTLNSKPPARAFAALYAERRGDVLAAQGQRDQARAAYRDALHALEAPNTTAARYWVQIKLDALGG